MPDAAVGLQEDMIGSTRIWILPNPSGLNAHYPPRALAAEFARLRVAAGLPDRSRPPDAPLCRDHPVRAVGGPWLRKVLVPSGLRAVVVPSGCRATFQPHWWMATWW
jgi:hypothetical protein